MENPKPPIYANEETLVQKALLHVQAIFDGNGFKKDNIKIISHAVKIQTATAGTYLELKPVMSESTAAGKVVIGEMVASRDAAMTAANDKMIANASNPTIQAKITAALLERNDKGFGLKNQIIPIEFINHDFTWHEPCHTCNGNGKSTCNKCMGRKLETCMKCHGRSMMSCPMCRGTGLLQGNKCNRCFGKRFVPCDGCRSSGLMPCRTCNASGISTCTTCGARGYKSFVLNLKAQALTYFEYDAKAMPKNAADAVEMYGSALVANNTIKVKGRLADEKENALGANYEIEFPAGDIIFQFKDREIKAQLFGYHAKITGMPNILDKILTPVMLELKEAVNDVGSVANKIKKATRYKLIGQAYLLLQKTNQKNAVRHIKKLYDVGLSGAMAQNIITLAYATTARITKKPRIIGLIIGLGVTSILTALYYALPARAAIVSKVSNPWAEVILEIILDVVPIFIGGILTTFFIQKTAAKSIQTALGHLVPDNQKHKLVANTMGLGLWSYIGAAVVSMMVLITFSFITKTSPSWFLVITNLIS